MALADNLTAYWRKEEASGNALDAHASNTLTDNGLVGTGTGKVGNARDYESGSSQFFSIADNADLSGADIDYTFIGWLNIESLTTVRYVLSKGESNSSAANLEYGVYIDSADSKMKAFISDGSAITTVVNNTVLSTGVWYFFVYYYDSVNNLLGLSINAGAAATQAQSTGARNGTGSFRLGASASGDFYFDGLMDEIGFYRGRVLSGAEITDLYNSGNGRDYAYITSGGASDAGPLICSGRLMHGKLLGPGRLARC